MFEKGEAVTIGFKRMPVVPDFDENGQPAGFKIPGVSGVYDGSENGFLFLKREYANVEITWILPEDEILMGKIVFKETPEQEPQTEQKESE